MDHLIALVPSIGTGILFFIVIRAIVSADRKEREALKKSGGEHHDREKSPRSSISGE